MANPYQPPESGTAATAEWEPADATRDAPQRVEFDLTEDDVVEFQFAHMRKTMRVRWILVLMAALLLLGSLAPALSGGSVGVASAFIAALLIALALWLGSRHQLRRSLQTARKAGRRMADLGRWSVSIDGAGLTFTAPGKEGRYRWMAMERVAESATHIAIYTTSITAIIVPKRAFSSAQAAADFGRGASRYLHLDRRQRGEPLAEQAGAGRGVRVLVLWLLLILMFLAIWQFLSPG